MTNMNLNVGDYRNRGLHKVQFSRATPTLIQEHLDMCLKSWDRP